MVKEFLELVKDMNLTNFEIHKYYQTKPRFNCVYSRCNLPKIKDGAYVINLDEYKSIETLWIALYVNGDNVRYFDSFGKEAKVLQQIFLEYKHIIH